MIPARHLWMVVLLVMQASNTGAQGPRRDYLQQGWTQDDRDWFYNTTQGSRQPFPDPWFLALKQAGNPNSLRDNANIKPWWFLPGTVSALNPNGLPVGFAKDIDKPWWLTILNLPN